MDYGVVSGVDIAPGGKNWKLLRPDLTGPRLRLGGFLFLLPKRDRWVGSSDFCWDISGKNGGVMGYFMGYTLRIYPPVSKHGMLESPRFCSMIFPSNLHLQGMSNCHS